jgi:hypothetical protein
VPCLAQTKRADDYITHLIGEHAGWNHKVRPEEGSRDLLIVTGE